MDSFCHIPLVTVKGSEIHLHGLIPEPTRHQFCEAHYTYLALVNNRLWLGLANTVEQCFATGVPRVAAKRSAETDRNCLGRNSRPQFYAIVAI